jgi:hypothetical protein
MVYFALLLVAFLFGGMLLFSVGFGTLSFKFLEPAVARKFIRKAFPYFYGYVLSVSALVCLLSFTISMTATVLAFFIFVTTLPTSIFLMPAINKASDMKQKRNFALLHSMSVVVTLSHIIVCAALLYLISNE